MKAWRAAALGACLACATIARAQPGDFESACAADQRRFCPTQMGGGLVNCLLQEGVRLSPPCAAYLAPLRPCAADAQSLCFGIPPGDNRIFNCLLSQRSQLSKACNDQLDTVTGMSR